MYQRCHSLLSTILKLCFRVLDSDYCVHSKASSPSLQQPWMELLVPHKNRKKDPFVGPLSLCCVLSPSMPRKRIWEGVCVFSKAITDHTLQCRWWRASDVHLSCTIREPAVGLLHSSGPDSCICFVHSLLWWTDRLVKRGLSALIYSLPGTDVELRGCLCRKHQPQAHTVFIIIFCRWFCLRVPAKPVLPQWTDRNWYNAGLLLNCTCNNNLGGNFPPGVSLNYLYCTPTGLADKKPPKVCSLSFRTQKHKTLVLFCNLRTHSDRLLTNFKAFQLWLCCFRPK